MKKILFALIFCIISLHAFSQGDDIVGKWQNPSGEGRIEISKEGDNFFGKLYWLKEPNDENGQPKKDSKNPDKEKQSRPIQGLQILQGFVDKGKGSYEDGTIYDPKSGKTYSCKMTLKDQNKLDIRGYVGVSLLGRTETWTRVKE
ncbi:DUF2147 domain-containing protein [Olivibacter sp. SDN3]|uniref:DUF2147 domain-containing protein n=1 Tax=Olivibacter sp. SDN3 TaxID=2764720 RepID=UPI001650F22F|nr:DUF2147 domain-containing protein [Olivibacter sp. SDN3]QNL48870.1 DUF2147 domain-containing protein [Olivibacter sp. SDN3]